MPLTNPNSSIQIINPGQVSPAAWWDFSDTSTITSSGGAISQLNDKSSNGRNLTQSTGASKPTTGTTTINGLNCGSFDGGDSLRLATPFIFGLASCVILGVFDLSVNGSILAEGNSGTDTPYFQALHTATNLRSIGRGDAGGATWEITGPAIGSGPRISMQQIDTGYGLFQLGYPASFSAAGTSYTRPTTTLNQMAMGCLPRSTDSNFITGKVGEIVVIDNLQGVDKMAGLYGYLVDKWA